MCRFRRPHSVRLPMHSHQRFYQLVDLTGDWFQLYAWGSLSSGKRHDYVSDDVMRGVGSHLQTDRCNVTHCRIRQRRPTASPCCALLTSFPLRHA